MKTRRILMTGVFTLTTLFALHTASFAQDDFSADVADDEEVASCVAADEAYVDLEAEVGNDDEPNMSVEEEENKATALQVLAMLFPRLFSINAVSTNVSLPLACSVYDRLYGFCIESMNPAKDYVFSFKGGTGTMTLYVAKGVSISTTVTSTIFSPPPVTITGYKIIDANHVVISYNVSGYSCFSGSPKTYNVGTITIKSVGVKSYTKSVNIYQACAPEP